MTTQIQQLNSGLAEYFRSRTVDQTSPNYRPFVPCCVGAHLAYYLDAGDNFLNGADAWAQAMGGNRAHAILVLRAAGAGHNPFGGAVWPVPPHEVFKRLAREHESLPDLAGADLKQVNLAFADLRGADLTGANLSGTSLVQANLSGAMLTGATLRYADMDNARLRYARLNGADLREAKLRWADLLGAWLGRANLQDANLEGANLYGCDLSGSDFRGARTEDMTWPAGWDPDLMQPTVASGYKEVTP